MPVRALSQDLSPLLAQGGNAGEPELVLGLSAEPSGKGLGHRPLGVGALDESDCLAGRDRAGLADPQVPAGLAVVAYGLE